MIWATSITDASFDSNTKAAAWAAWIRVDGRSTTIKEHGLFKIPIQDANHAELYAALNGIWLAVNVGRAQVVLAQTDSMAVCHAIWGKHRIYTDILKAQLQATGLSGINLKARHVPGHSGGKDARSWVNEWCDTKAGLAMREQRKSIR